MLIWKSLAENSKCFPTYGDLKTKHNNTINVSKLLISLQYIP